MDLLLYIGVILFIGIFLLIIIQRRRRLSSRDQALVMSHWEALTLKVKTEPRQALIEADKVLDFVLQKKGYSGSLGEKLKKAQVLFSDVNAIWEAHKLRNRVAHELGFNLSEGQARVALSQIKRGLEDMGVQF